MQVDPIKMEFLKKIDYDIKRYEDLKKIIKRIYDIEEELYTKRKSIFNDISKISETGINDLGPIYKSLTDEMKDNEENRNKYLINSKINYDKALSQLLSYSKEEKKRLENNYYYKTENRRHEIDSKLNQIQKNGLSGNQEKPQFKNGEDKNIGEALVIYEKERILNYKYMILHLIHSKLKFHSDSVGKLTDLYKEIKFFGQKEDQKKDSNKKKIKINSTEINENKKSTKKDLSSSQKGMINTKSIKSDIDDDLDI